MIKINPFELASFAVHGYGAMQKIPEFAALIDLVDNGEPKIIMEIGAGRGGTSWAWSKLTKLDLLIVLDLPNGPWGGTDLKATMEEIGGNTDAKVVFIEGNSRNAEALAAVKLALLQLDDSVAKIDFLLIDGDHSHDGVKSDFLTYKELVKDGGLIAFHDICVHPPEAMCDVDKFWAELKASGISEDNYCEFIAEPVSWGGLGVVKKTEGL